MKHTPDMPLVSELESFGDWNSSERIKRKALDIVGNMNRKAQKGIFDPALALKGFMYLADDVSKEYAKEYGLKADRATRTELARRYVESYITTLKK